MDRRLAEAAVAGAVLGFAAAAYPALWRDRCLNWGSRADEAARDMPGDRLLPDAPVVTTRAIGVNAPASAIWPWLVRMSARAGVYTHGFPLGERVRMRVETLEPGHSMVLRSDDGRRVWSFGLYPEAPSAPGGAQTRLVSRNRIQHPRTGFLASAPALYIREPCDLVMERKTLLGIKQSAEQPSADPGDHAGAASRDGRLCR